MSHFSPPTTGFRYIGEVVDFNATHNANHPLYSYVDENATGGIRIITHSEFADACHRAAYLIRPELTSPRGDVVAIIANIDIITYHAIVIGMILAGLVPFPISPRNSPAAILNLLQKANCHRILTTKDSLQSQLDVLVAYIASSDPSFAVQIDESPTVLQLYSYLESDTKGSQKREVHYPWKENRPDVRSPCLYLHSSGSTGFPKPIPWSHKVLALWSNIPAVRKFKQIDSSTIISAMPLPAFHTIGILIQFIIPTFSGATLALFPPLVLQPGNLPMLPSPDNVLEHTKRTHCNVMMILPSFLQTWGQDPAAIEQLKGLDEIHFTGGVLPTKIGDVLVDGGVNVQTLYGGTEFGVISAMNLRSQCDKDWEYLSFDRLANIRLVPQGNRVYEGEVLRSDAHEPAIFNMPDGEGYSTSDLFEEHPTRKGFYKLIGRVDDVIIHSSGEKTVPAPMEDIILSDPRVGAVVLFGRGESLVGALIELKPAYQVNPEDDSAIDNMKAELWPTIEKANHIAPAFSRIYSDMIIFVPPDMPLPRAGKGTVMRRAAIHAFEVEIKDLYRNVESASLGIGKVNAPNSWDKDACTTWIVQQLEDLHPGTIYDITADLFEQGMDSLGVTFIRQRIVAAFRQVDEPRLTRAAETITDNQVYAHPTVHSLVQYLLSLLSDEGEETLADARQEIQDVIRKFSADLAAPPKTHTQLQDPIVVLLTGSTGNLGVHLLTELLQDQNVAKIFVLNRQSSTPPLTRQKKMFIGHGLDVELLGLGKLVYLEGDAAQDHLGLGPAVYEELRNSINVILHNAWRLDFNLGLSSFQSNIRGTRNLINLGLTGTHNTSLRFVFTSSVASAQSWDQAKGPFPEESLDDASVAVGPGYGASKYVSERILVGSGLQFCTLRIGQLSGGYPNGAWATTDWLPILVKSSIQLGMLPSSPGVVSWLSMNIVAKTIRDVILSKYEPPKAINMVHPHPVPWNDVIQRINEALVNQGVIKARLQLIPFNEWVRNVEKHAVAPTNDVLKAIPAIKLTDFFKSLANAKYSNPVTDETGTIIRFSTTKSQAISPAFRHSKSIEKDDAERWVRYWKSVGYFVA